jgi:hypothetical protein
MNILKVQNSDELKDKVMSYRMLFTIIVDDVCKGFFHKTLSTYGHIFPELLQDDFWVENNDKSIKLCIMPCYRKTQELIDIYGIFKY